jgi:cell division topological specificity factor
MFWGRRKTKDTLKNRLQVVLQYDRAGLPPGREEMLRNELMAVIQKYFPGAKSQPNLNVERRGENVILTADIPLD